MKYLTILFFVCFTPLLAQGNKSIIVDYQNISLVDFNSLDPEFKADSEKMRMMRDIKKKYENSRYTLEILNQTSLFETQFKMSIYDKPNVLAEIERKKKYYIDDSVYLNQFEYFGELLLIEEKSNEVKWELSTETKQVLGYQCYKAIYLKEGTVPLKIEAWYAPELPFNFGPKGYHGLPGLILETIQNDKLSCVAFSIKTDEDVYIIKPTGGKKISRDDFDKKNDDKVKFMKSNFSEN